VWESPFNLQGLSGTGPPAASGARVRLTARTTASRSAAWGTSVEGGWRESSRPELLAVCGLQLPKGAARTVTSRSGGCWMGFPRRRPAKANGTRRSEAARISRSSWPLNGSTWAMLGVPCPPSRGKPWARVAGMPQWIHARNRAIRVTNLDEYRTTRRHRGSVNKLLMLVGLVVLTASVPLYALAQMQSEEKIRWSGAEC
jgi:hypothetical protein